MYFFLRTVRRRREAALLGALSWGFGGYLLATVNLLPILYAVVPLPAALAFLLRAWRGGRWRDAAGLAACGGLVGLAGEPSTLLGAAPLALAALGAHSRRRPARPLVVAAGALAAFAIAAPAIVPGLIHVRRTARAEGLPADIGWAFPLPRLAEIVLPHVTGHPDEADPAWYWGRPLYPRKGVPFLYAIYPGLLATALALAAAARRRRSTAVWTGAAIASVVVAAGPRLLVWNALHALPLVNGIRYPEKFLLVACFSGAVLAAAGWDFLARVRRPLRLSIALFGAAAAACAIALVFLPAPRGLVPATHQPLLAGVLRRDFLAAAVAALLAAAALSLPRRLRASGAAIVLTADLLAAGRGLVRTRPIAELQKPSPVLAPLAARPPDGPVAVLLLDTSVAGRLHPTRTLSEPKPAQWGIATALGIDFDVTNLRWTDRATDFVWNLAGERPQLLGPLLARRGIAALVVPRADAAGRIRLALVRPEKSHGFAFFAARVEPLASDDAWPETVRRLGPAAADTVCLAAKDARGLPRHPAAGRVGLIERKPDEVTIDVDGVAAAPGVLAVDQTWAPGWRAEIDGRPARILRADVDLSAIVIPPGARRVVLRYADPSVPISVAIALAGLLGALGMALAGGRRAP